MLAKASIMAEAAPPSPGMKFRMLDALTQISVSITPRITERHLIWPFLQDFFMVFVT